MIKKLSSILITIAIVVMAAFTLSACAETAPLKAEVGPVSFENTGDYHITGVTSAQFEVRKGDTSGSFLVSARNEEDGALAKAQRYAEQYPDVDVETETLAGQVWYVAQPQDGTFTAFIDAENDYVVVVHAMYLNLEGERDFFNDLKIKY